MNIYTDSDLYFSAYLISLGYDVVDVVGDKKKEFIFNMEPSVAKGLKLEFYTSNSTVKAYDYAAAIKKLKATLYQ